MGLVRVSTQTSRALLLDYLAEVNRLPALFGCALIAALIPALGNHAEAAAATYVGGRACAGCHPAETERWTGSHHDLAMQPANAKTVLGNFDNATFTKDGVTSTFFRRDGAFYVRTDGPDGTMRDYRIAYTFGVDPLQQYLIELPGGRLQALGVAWDARPAAAGGARWFHLYPNERIDHRDVLHWTAPMQNWNFMCADCHSTNLRKNYRPAQDRFETTWSDLDVACEACHGPGSRHVQWAADARAGTAGDDPLRGFATALRDTSGGRWELAPGASTAHRTAPRASAVELETSGRCQSRTAQIWGDAAPREALAQTRRLSLLDAHRYHADGQIEDEVYEYGSFVQSKMYRAGVSCSDCHDPHSGRLRAAGNALCVQCHQPATFDVAQHHHHAPGTPGAQCVSCHMIERIYMVVDGRRDHSFRLPRPDLSERLGTPNACTDCHADKPARWAAEAVTNWYGARPWHFGEALAAGRAGRPGAAAELLRTIDDARLPAIARATAVTLLPPSADPRALAAVHRAAGDSDPLVRRAAAESLTAFEVAPRIEIGVPLLADPVRTVRLEAVGSLLDVPRSALSDTQRAALDRGIAEYRQVQRFNADRAEAQVNLGMLEARLGNGAAARQAFETAIRLQPSFTPAYVDLADLQRLQGDEGEAAATLRRALQVAPDDAAVHEALGLSLVRQQRVRDALPELARAAQLAPDVARYAYVHAIALHDSGDIRAAIDVLTRAHERHPGAPEIVIALAEYEAQTGNRAAALVWARRLAQISDSPQTRRLIADLERSPSGTGH
jgi:predicted CXXCH cytochrome family protein